MALIIHTECSKGWGGQEIRIIDELKGMRSKGFDVGLAAPKVSEIYRRAKKEGISVYPIAFASKVDLSSWYRLFRLFERLKPDVVNTHSSEDSWMAGFAARMQKVPLVIRSRHISTPIGSTFSYRYFPNLILTTSEAIRSDLIKKKLSPEKIYAVPSGTNLNRFKFSRENRTRIRDEFGISDKDVVVGNVCVLRSWKGLDFFIETAASAPNRYKFMIIGDGPQREHLEQKVREIGLDGKVIFTGHRENVDAYFSALDIFFFTSYASEGVPQALLQALSVGLPVVSCKNPSVLETLKSFRPCPCVEYGDVFAAVNALEKTISMDDAQVLENRKIVEENYGFDVMMAKLLSLYGQYIEI